MRVIPDSTHFFLNDLQDKVLKFIFTSLIIIDQYIFDHLFSFIIVLKKKSCPDFPDLKFKGRVNPDTSISQINEKNLASQL